ncbi:MAG: Tryptophan synthase alpha chain [uncultured Solirubrobacterales bacterium]|uniref:Tryptophan synthase alpha chain n=1 Tax=uncultured Solirubrobacterales bacterium TaxID=768556 RepID=A0A6J4SQJ1_9ACTN|nr:MAG: Tryptophan synthase alpha chain [uncultured Solirubrobacterales bacterium]
MTDRIGAAFAGHGRRAALMPYLMGGYPDLETSRAAAEACADAGADLIELGVPFSDPLADGPVIHAAGTHALAGGVTVEQVLGVCAAAAARLPVMLMIYANAVLAHGAEAFVARAADAGAAGLIVPDLPHDEADELRAACDAAGLALIPLVAPSTNPDRLNAIGADARGFVYTVSLAGTTGERSALPPELPALVERVRAAASPTPVAVGFGIASSDQARAVAEIADGVIVGSRVVRASGEGGATAVRDLVGELARALE